MVKGTGRKGSALVERGVALRRSEGANILTNM